MINLNEVCDCCGGTESQPILQLFDDRCFRVVEGKDVHGEFCLKDFAFPADGYSCIGLNVDTDGGEILIFDNKLDTLSPSSELISGELYARGILIRIVYPTYDNNGESLTLADKSMKLYIENGESLAGIELPLYDLFTMFTNPKSNKTSELINKIKVVNPSTKFKIRVVALVIDGKAD
jgi:hypothetical protein